MTGLWPCMLLCRSQVTVLLCWQPSIGYLTASSLNHLMRHRTSMWTNLQIPILHTLLFWHSWVAPSFANFWYLSAPGLVFASTLSLFVISLLMYHCSNNQTPSSIACQQSRIFRPDVQRMPSLAGYWISILGTTTWLLAPGW